MKEKKTHGVQLLLRAVVRNPDGKIITDTGQKPAKSFVIQFLESIYGLTAVGIYNCTDLDGGESRIYNTPFTFDGQCMVNAPANDDSYGIVIGTGDTAETNEDCKLETQITEGVGGGNITHGVQVIDAVAVVGANVDWKIKRAFTNLTGSTITVKEAGVYATTPLPSFLMIRDVFETPVEVPDKCTLTVIYTLRTTV